jgi:hypothetical protein
MPTGFDLWKEVNGVNPIITRTMGMVGMLVRAISILAVLALLGLWATLARRK